MLSHCIVFQGCLCLNFNHSNIGAYFFPNFLHNMVDYNTKNSITKKIPFFNLYCAIPNIFMAKKVHNCVLKNENIFKK